MGRDLRQLQTGCLTPSSLKAELSPGRAQPYPQQHISTATHLPSCSLNPVDSVHRLHLQMPHAISPNLGFPHPDRCIFPLVSPALLCPSRSQAQGDQPMLPPPFQQHGRVRHDKASQSRERPAPSPSWLPAGASPSSTALDGLGQLWVGPAASPEQEASAGKRSARRQQPPPS